MASKRPFRDQVRTQGPNKRLKSSPSTKTSRPRTTNIDHSKPVSIEELKWSAVTLPDRFEDAEGFFGLEEIEGVEVLKAGGEGDGQGREVGKVQYRVYRLPHWNDGRRVVDIG